MLPWVGEKGGNDCLSPAIMWTLDPPPGAGSTHKRRSSMKCVRATQGRTLPPGDFVWVAFRSNPRPSILKCIFGAIWNKSENSQQTLQTPVFQENSRNMDVSKRLFFLKRLKVACKNLEKEQQQIQYDCIVWGFKTITYLPIVLRYSFISDKSVIKFTGWECTC